MHDPTRSRRALAAVAALVLALGALVASPAPVGAEPPEPTEDGRPPRDLRAIEVLNVSHRGEVQGSTNPPENTLAAIEEAMRVGADAVEVDVTPTADDQLVLMHDRTLNRTTDATEVFGPGTHVTADFTLAELRTLSAGTFDGEVQQIPTFTEVLELVRGRIGLLIDVKYDHGDTDIEALIAAELRAQPGFEEWGPDSVSFGSYGWTLLQAARELLPELELTFIMNYLCTTPDGLIVAGDLPPDRAEGIPGVTPFQTTIDQFVQILVDGGIDTVGIFALSTYRGSTASCASNDFTPDDVDRFAAAGIRFSQNAEDPTAMQDRIDRGVRAILTDYPDTLATVLPAPDAPTGVAATAGVGSATVTWTPPDPFVGSRRTGHRVTVEPGGATVEVGPDATTAEVSGLAEGIPHTFTVQALNFAGPSAPSTPSAPVTPGPAPSADEAYVGYLYATFLGRSADPAGAAHWTSYLAAGGSRGGLARRLALSGEATQGRTLERPYQAWLGRAPDAGARAHWSGRLRAGVPLEEVEAALLSSAELRARAGGTDEAWVRELYRLLGGRCRGPAVPPRSPRGGHRPSGRRPDPAAVRGVPSPPGGGRLPGAPGPVRCGRSGCRPLRRRAPRPPRPAGGGGGPGRVGRGLRARSALRGSGLMGRQPRQARTPPRGDAQRARRRPRRSQQDRCQWRRSSGASRGTTTRWPRPGGMVTWHPGQA
ncbi:glycerophosphodiester phosphodiesterase family protein [Iamia majanohamensis]|uniref:Glycerophosphodiester phosphodiesterase family protein n=1 Tax=Iamia majanohamensis TaxID=467976 RepID=A0AAF0BUH9_9ACTN|nr:glycerophosphodiester phosphodiesterase family protein [Iamia majanohamensis]WCO65439.1 glycerophosphodiester phosphodiesterase family protein [Iamia majanohamensis]